MDGPDRRPGDCELLKPAGPAGSPSCRSTKIRGSAAKQRRKRHGGAALERGRGGTAAGGSGRNCGPRAGAIREPSYATCSALRSSRTPWSLKTWPSARRENWRCPRRHPRFWRNAGAQRRDDRRALQAAQRPAQLLGAAPTTTRPNRCGGRLLLTWREPGWACRRRENRGWGGNSSSLRPVCRSTSSARPPSAPKLGRPSGPLAPRSASSSFQNGSTRPKTALGADQTRRQPPRAADPLEQASSQRLEAEGGPGPRRRQTADRWEGTAARLEGSDRLLSENPAGSATPCWQAGAERFPGQERLAQQTGGPSPAKGSSGLLQAVGGAGAKRTASGASNTKQEQERRRAPGGPSSRKLQETLRRTAPRPRCGRGPARRQRLASSSQQWIWSGRGRSLPPWPNKTEAGGSALKPWAGSCRSVAGFPEPVRQAAGGPGARTPSPAGNAWKRLKRSKCRLEELEQLRFPLDRTSRPPDIPQQGSAKSLLLADR